MSISNKLKLISLMMVFVTSSSFASETVWDFTTSNSATTSFGSGSGTSSYGNSLTFNQNGNSVNVTAWADTNEVSSGSDKIESATAANNYWGLLNYNRNSGDEHYVDNNGDFEMLLLDFGDAVSLTSIDLGSYSNDSDVSIGAFTSMPTLNGSTWSSVASSAFFTTSFSNIGNAAYAINNLKNNIVVEARYWLIGAYNTAFGGNTGWTGAKDYIKIAGITTKNALSPKPDDSTAVPEPSSLAIFACFGMALLWRRRQKM